jgi:hypothetical protein
VVEIAVVLPEAVAAVAVAAHVVEASAAVQEVVVSAAAVAAHVAEASVEVVALVAEVEDKTFGGLKIKDYGLTMNFEL